VDNTNLTRYTDLDFSAHRRAQLERIQERWPGQWNDLLSSNFGMFLVDMMAWNMATMAFLVNRQAGEVFIDSMSLRESAIRIGALGGYRLRGPSPATVSCEVSITASLSNTIQIKKGTIVRTASDVPFETALDYEILPGETTPVTLVVEFSPEKAGSNVIASLVKVVPGSENIDLVDSSVDLTQFVTTGQEFRLSAASKAYTISAITASDGAISNNRLVLSEPYSGLVEDFVEAEVVDRRIVLTQGQTVTEQFTAPGGDTTDYYIRLGRTPVIDNSVTVSVNDEAWAEVTNALDLSPSKSAFIVKTTTTGVTVVQFGDGQLGQAVPANSVITVTYRVGGGLVGNVATGTIATSIIGFVTSNQNPVTVTISNRTASGQGGADEESLEEARAHIPLFIKANDRAVTIDDCQEVARSFANPQFGTVSFARAFSRATSSVLEGNIIELYCWTTGSGGALVPLSSAMKLALKEWMDARKMGTDYIIIADGASRPVPISFRFKTAQGFNLSDTTQLLNDTLRSIVNSLRPGDPIVFSTLVHQLVSVQGVESVIMATPNNDLTTSSPTELFTSPMDNYAYEVALNYSTDTDSATDGERVTIYTAQLPVAPLTPWSFVLNLGAENLAVLAGTVPGTARLYASRVLSTDENYPSFVNLLTGQATLCTKGVIGALALRLKTVQGYNAERFVNVYASYIGQDSTEKRQEIRTRIKSWGDGLDIGGTLYGQEISGITVSKSNVTTVIESTPDVDQVTKIALGTPINDEPKMAAGETELLRIGQIVLNGNPN